jgi:SAM-dependent methyltransferase
MMTDAGEWQGRSGDAWASEWRRTDRAFGPLTERLLERSREFRFERALDVGCGAGELSLALARGRPQIEVVGVDISPAVIQAARERGDNRDNAAFEVADAASWQPADGFAPDLVVSRHGVMFFDDPVAAFEHLAAIAAPGAGLMFSCFRDPAENPFFSEMAKVLPAAHAPTADGPGPFAFADSGRVEQILAAAGWSALQFEPFDFAMIAGAGRDPVGDAVHYFTHIGPAARALREMADHERERCVERINDLAQRNRFENIVSLRAATWIVTGRKG